MSLQSILVLVIIFVLLGVAIGFYCQQRKGLARRLHRQLRQLPGTLQ